MKLLTLKLRNFQGGKDTIHLEGQNLNIFGDNGTGKTRLASAFSWLLFGKDALNRTDFEILPLNSDGQRIKEVTQAEVEASLTYTGTFAPAGVDDNLIVTLSRVYIEKWGQRGPQRGKLLGHTTEYFIDGVPKPEKDYKAFINQIMPEQQFRLLTNPLYFNDVLPWLERRKVLVDIAGDVSDVEVIGSDKSLAELPKLLEGRKFEDARAVIEGKRKALRKSLDDIPTRIDEAQRGLPNVVTASSAGMPAGCTPQSLIESGLASLRDQRALKVETRTQILSGGGIAEKRIELRQIEGEMLALQNTQNESINREINDWAGQLQSTGRAEQDHRLTITRKSARITENDLVIKQSRDTLSAYKEQWQNCNSSIFVYEDSETCPTCGQPLPQEKVQAARTKAEADFNVKKSQRLEGLVARATELRAGIDQLQKDNAALTEEIKQANEQVGTLVNYATDVQAKIDELNKRKESMTALPAYIALKSKHDLIEGAIALLQAGDNFDTAAIDKEIKAMDSQIADSERTLAAVQQHDQGMKRIDELKGQEKQWNADLEKLDKLLWLMERFTQAKVTMLTDKINGMFELARFKLFDIQVNEGIKECCETTYLGIPWDAGLNHGAQISVGMDIIRRLQAHYGVTCPVWIDNREAITQIPEMDCQVISLIVSEKDKALRIEKEGTK